MPVPVNRDKRILTPEQIGEFGQRAKEMKRLIYLS